MIRLSIYIVFLCLPYLAFTQPGNSTCDGVIDLGTFPICGNTVYTNSGATAFDIAFDNTPSCFKDGAPQHDVWFGFITPNEKKEIIITIESTTNNGIKNIQAALYRGVCAVNSLALRKCAVAESGETKLSFDAFDLTPNAQYYVRVDNYGGDQNEGDFTFCIDEKRNDVNITNGSTELCSGRLFDSGGPTGNYGDNESYTYTICPSEFHRCVNFDMTYFNIEHEAEGIGEKIIFYNGPDTDSPIISAIGADVSFGTAHGGGGSCYKVQADDCLTIQFISDGSINFEGFAGSWECTVQPCKPNEQLKISGDLTRQQIEAAVSTPLSKVTIDTIICNPRAYGTFDGGDETDLGLNRGLLLTTGSPFSAIGPNNDDNVTTINETLGDNDLDILSQLNGEGSTSNDACVVEMDVEVFSNELTFEYIFASDEYPEFVGEAFNDIFALLISGPGIEGIQEIGNQKNLAVLPNGEFVQINSVNHLSNWEYYRNNAYGQSIEYDGMTSGFEGKKKSLTASAEIIPCNTYHLKLAIADRGDFAFDSGVFIAEISSGVPSINLDVARNTEYLVEKCSGNQDKITITLNRPLSMSTTFLTSVEGTATQGQDYQTNLPEEIIFAPGETSKSFSIIPIADDEAEGSESIIINLMNETDCGTVNLAELNVELRDAVDVEIDFESDVYQTCTDSEVVLSATGAVEYEWISENIILDPESGTTTLIAQQDGWVYVRGSFGNDEFVECAATDSIFLDVIEPEVSISTLQKSNYCKGEEIDLTINSNANSSTFKWETTAGEVTGIGDEYKLTADTPGQEQTIIVEQLTGSCFTYDTIMINVDDFFFPEFNFTNTEICQSTPTEIVPFVIPSTTIYEWSTSIYLSDPNIANPIVTPEEDQIYTLTATSENNYCRIDTSISINVFKNEIEILEQDTVSLCEGGELYVEAQTEDGNTNPFVVWEYDQVSTGVGGLIYTGEQPSQSGYLTAKIFSGECINSDSIYVEADALPNLDIKLIPDRNSFCAGEVVTLLSADFPNTFYPNIEFEWKDVEEDSEQLNLVFITDESRHFIRETRNGNCTSIDSIYIDVTNINARLNVVDTTLCQGDVIDVFIESDIPPDEIIWQSDICFREECDQIEFVATGNIVQKVLVKSGRCSEEISFIARVEENTFVTIENLTRTVPLGAEIEVFASTSEDYEGDHYWYLNDELLDERSELLTVRIIEDSKIQVFLDEELGCFQSESTLYVTVNIPEIVFPNAFVPSSQTGVNQTFTYVAIVEGKGFPNAFIDVETFEVFNRWGERVFNCQSQACLDRGWSGRRNGQEEPSGVYAFIFKGMLPNGDEIIKKGNVTLIR